MKKYYTRDEVKRLLITDDRKPDKITITRGIPEKGGRIGKRKLPFGQVDKSDPRMDECALRAFDHQVKKEKALDNMDDISTHFHKNAEGANGIACKAFIINHPDKEKLYKNAVYASKVANEWQEARGRTSPLWHTRKLPP